MKTVLLITERFDPTADLIISELRRREEPCVRWNLDQIPTGSTLTYRASNERFDSHIVTDGRTINLADVASIWWRGFQPSGFPANLVGEQRQFAIMEWRLALMALMKIGDFFWINHPERERLADSKPAQLYAARKFGLEIAPTIITNNPDEVRSFLAHTKGAVVYKGLAQPLNMEPGKALFTRELTEKEIANLDLISVTPGIFQAHIEKAYEVRATVVGTRIFAAKIDSQSAFATRTDWRRAPFEVQYEAIFLPPEIETGIHDLMRYFDLVYGAFDFIVAPDGRYLFLEVNPAGQYMWIEYATGLKITETLADALGEPCSA
jgi:glutathione synthase/RimK-type ligase-like ATP-grasp enzyme